VLSLLLLVAGPSWANCKVGRLVELPVTMQGEKPTISAKINGADVRLIADSAALTRNASDRQTPSRQVSLPPGPCPLNFSSGEAMRVSDQPKLGLFHYPRYESLAVLDTSVELA